MECIFIETGQGYKCKFCGTQKARATRRNCNRSTGLGDTISKITSALGIRPCGGCRGRQDKLNGWFQYDRPQPPQWVSTLDLVVDTYQLAAKLPRGIDAVVGIPRSGIIPASILATHLHVPLYSLADGVMVHTGQGSRLDAAGDHQRVLVVDDTVMNGHQLKRAKAALPGGGYLFAAVYVNPLAKGKPDYQAAELEQPHLLEWNFFNCGYIANCATDMDGIICEDPRWEGLTEKQQERELETVAPRWIPRQVPVQAIITARLEKHRQTTEVWLGNHGAKYGKLIMGPWASDKERGRPGAVSQWKGEQFERLKPNFFIESDPRLAQDIAAMTGGWVICPAAKTVF